MPKTHPPYPEEFREQIISLHRSGQLISNLADEFEPCYQTIRSSILQAELDEGKREDGLTSEEKEELRELRKENRKLKQEREILKKAAAYIKEETNSTNSGSSNS